MGKRSDRDDARKRAGKLGVAAPITVLLCGDEKVGKCASAAAMRSAWKHLRQRAKQLRKEQGIRIFAVRTKCVDVCRYGPVAAILPDGCWYGGCDEATLDRILEAHIDGKRGPAKNLIAEPPEPSET